MSAERLGMIRARIEAAIGPAELDVADDSHLHAGHAGARDGRGHFRVRVVSNKFAGLTPLQRHRLVYEAVGDLMQSHIHALAVAAITEGEARQQRQRAP